MYKLLMSNFCLDLTHWKSLKSVNFWQSYSKNKKVDILGDTVYIWERDKTLKIYTTKPRVSITN